MVKMWKVSLFVIFLLIFCSLVVAENENDCLYFFYGSGCEGCDEVEEMILRLDTKYEDLQIEKFEVYHKRSNYQKLQDYFLAYDVPKSSQGIPVVFMTGTYFVGVASMNSLLEERILNNEDSACPSLQENVIGEL